MEWPDIRRDPGHAPHGEALFADIVLYTSGPGRGALPFDERIALNACVFGFAYGKDPAKDWPLY